MGIHLRFVVYVYVKMEVMKLIITFTNIQIVRNYLYDRDLDLLDKLHFSESLLICNSSTFDSVAKRVSDLPLNQQKKIKIIQINYTQNKVWLFRLFNAIFKSHVSSKFAFNKILRSKSKGEITRANLVIKMLLYFATYKNKFSAKFLRFFYLKCFCLFEDFTLLSNFRDYDTVLTLSLTEDLDVYVAMFANVNSITSIGTVRSWDNLTSHGLLRVKPDIFYSHSLSMFDDLVRFQYFEPKKDQIKVGISNWINFDRVVSLKSKVKVANRNILFGSMGLYFNPSEIALLDYVYQLKSSLKSEQISFTVLMHPKFLLPYETQKRYSNFITFFSFKFDNIDESKSYSDYLEYLSNFDLILSSGSTLLLDACLINKSVAHINFELSDVPFWESIKRYLDFREYYQNFIKLSKTPVLSNIEEFEGFLRFKNTLAHSNAHDQDLASKYILGDESQLSLTKLINNSMC